MTTRDRPAFTTVDFVAHCEDDVRLLADHLFHDPNAPAESIAQAVRQCMARFPETSKDELAYPLFFGAENGLHDARASAARAAFCEGFGQVLPDSSSALAIVGRDLADTASTVILRQQGCQMVLQYSDLREPEELQWLARGAQWGWAEAAHVLGLRYAAHESRIAAVAWMVRAGQLPSEQDKFDWYQMIGEYDGPFWGPERGWTDPKTLGELLVGATEDVQQRVFEIACRTPRTLLPMLPDNGAGITHLGHPPPAGTPEAE